VTGRSVAGIIASQTALTRVTDKSSYPFLWLPNISLEGGLSECLKADKKS